MALTKKNLYTTSVHVQGGREGHAVSADKNLDVKLTAPKELGGSGKVGFTNPEQLFAAGYAACFESALRHVARQRKVALKDAAVTATVGLAANDDNTFQLSARLDVSVQGVDDEMAQALVEGAHRVCPYSNATRGNIEVTVELVK